MKIRKMKPVRVLAFDIGTVNLAVRGEKITKNKITPLIYELINVGTKKLGPETWDDLTEYFDEQFKIENYDYILLEGQIGYIAHTGSPVNNVKMQVFLEVYFRLRYPHIPVHSVSPLLKYPKELRGKKANTRKKWAVERMIEIYTERGDEESLQVLRDAKRVKKADDLADASLIILAFFKRKIKLLPKILETP